MGDSSESEEFYDAEEFTPIKGSKRSSLCKSISVTDSVDGAVKENPATETVENLPNPAETLAIKPLDTLAIKPTEALVIKPVDNLVTKPSETPATVTTAPSTPQPVIDDKTIIKSVVQGRKQFQELRRCMQTEEEDEIIADPGGSIEPQTFSLEHPFKLISHDTMSLQSMTSLGRIGRILSGVSESQPNIRSASSREPSTADAPCPEPDVIASTKAGSLKNRAAPAPPPRRKKLNKLHGSQSLSTAEGDNLSVCTAGSEPDEARRGEGRAEGRLSLRRHLDDARADCRGPRLVTDDGPDRPPARRPAGDKPHLHSLIVEAGGAGSAQFAALPSPASTIESLTREFQDSLELSHSKYASDMSISIPDRSETRHRSVTDTHIHDSKQGINVDSWSRPNISGAGEDVRRPTHSGHSSLGSTTRRGAGAARRRSAGDEAGAAAALRTRTVSGHTLSDTEILDQVTVLNLDTGERVPLSVAEHKLPQCINPLSLHIMRLTSEYIANHDDDNARETDEESESVCAGVGEDEAKETKGEAADRQASGIKRKTEKLKRFFGSTVKRTVEAAKSLAAEVSSARHKEDVADIVDDVRGETNIKLKASNSHKGPYDFDGCVRHVQEMGSGHCGAVWCCKFSVCGRLLATAGQDKLLRVWVTRDAFHMFQEMRTKYSSEKKSSPSPSLESVSVEPPKAAAPFHPVELAIYAGHASDLLDLSWSKNYFLLSSSMDKTVRLWHISRHECLCCFQHIDFVTAIVFHPRDDRYFLSGSLDGKLRLWDIPDKKVAVWNEVDGKTKLITAANFCQNGKFAVVGTYDGRCIFYTTDQLKYHTQIDVRSTRGKNSTGRKISGIEPMPNDDKILVTSNDSRIRLYDLRDLNLSCKYKGYVNVSSQIKASFSHDGKYIVSGSENQCIYIWKTYHDYSKFSSVRRDRNDFWEGIKAHNAVVTCTVFAPNPDHIIKMIAEREQEEAMTNKDFEAKEEVKAAEGMVSSSQTGHVLVSADFNGCIKVFVHKAKPKHSSLPASALA